MISAVPPKKYSDRFIEFMKQEVIINEKKNMLSSGIKKKEFEKLKEKFDDLYHVGNMCNHCGRTYNREEDRRVSAVKANLNANRVIAPASVLKMKQAELKIFIQ